MTTTDEDNGKPIDNSELKDVVALAAYIEQLLMSEQQWIMNRLSWLFTSQSFLLTAFVLLLINSQNSTPSPSVHRLLIGLPFLGLICCVTVGVAIIAAERVSKHLGDQRDLLSISITQRAKDSLSDTEEAKGLAKISRIGFNREQKWTLIVGALPHWLPWMFALLWLSLLLP
ncbi:hypothetical protein PN437_14655 [Microcystis aeruginosa CS-564/01]|uniref:hypothetical protein n=1 Tax=Microcystis aeruginosa TaxID=1126 RepID=UPI002330E9BD|nr:hypothetical protein [Microcystis aeruginosa]MDB9426115.1 hypothetical protein [Microcystis aeruginosa CS-564/01]